MYFDNPEVWYKESGRGESASTAAIATEDDTRPLMESGSYGASLGRTAVQVPTVSLKAPPKEETELTYTSRAAGGSNGCGCCTDSGGEDSACRRCRCGEPWSGGGSDAARAKAPPAAPTAPPADVGEDACVRWTNSPMADSPSRARGASFEKLIRDTFPELEHVSFAYGREDQARTSGTLTVSIYVGMWVLGALIFPTIIVLLALRCWIAGGVLGGLVLASYVIPVRQSERLRRCLRPRFARYFREASLSFERLPSEEPPTLLCLSPHGVFSMGWALAFLADELSDFQFCFSSFLRLNPFLRLLTGSLGKPNDVSKSTVIKLMRNQENITLIPGAWHEATLHSWRQDRVWLRSRKGFVKYALRYGYSLTPSFCFGERFTYRNVQGCYDCRFWLNSRKIITILPFGRWWLPLLPRPGSPLHLVVGTPVLLPRIANPTDEDVDRWHSVFIQRLQAHYEKYSSFFYQGSPVVRGGSTTTHTLEVW